MNWLMKVIEAVAADSERKGMFEESVKLYDLAGKHEKVIGLLNKLLSQVSLLTKRSLPHALSILYLLVTVNLYWAALRLVGRVFACLLLELAS